MCVQSGLPHRSEQWSGDDAPVLSARTPGISPPVEGGEPLKTGVCSKVCVCVVWSVFRHRADGVLNTSLCSVRSRE